MKLSISGQMTLRCPESEFIEWVKRIISGLWVLLGPVDPVPKSLSIREKQLDAENPLARLAVIVTVTWKFGIWCSCNTIVMLPEN